jgi:hypothetical protein
MRFKTKINNLDDRIFTCNKHKQLKKRMLSPSVHPAWLARPRNIDDSETDFNENAIAWIVCDANSEL